MNREQRSYLSNRLRSVASAKITGLAKQRSHKEFNLKFEECYKLIAAGKAELKPLSEINSYTDLADAYYFPGEKEFLATKKKNNQDIDRKIEAIKKEEELLLDRINLEKDAEPFLALIEKFVNKKF